MFRNVVAGDQRRRCVMSFPWGSWPLRLGLAHSLQAVASWVCTPALQVVALDSLWPGIVAESERAQASPLRIA